jgi:hypothetical protein
MAQALLMTNNQSEESKTSKSPFSREIQMLVPRAFRFRRRSHSSPREQIYCRRHNRFYLRCPVEHDLHSCECLSQCEVAFKGNGARVPGERLPQRA